nr:Chain C, 10-mer peptide from BZLF1 trans-activator protein [synthetic construct]2AXG_C Chain C, 10-mer peptide from BZLF1 trans-activator protein [synthetic construct]
APQPAPENAY